MLRQHEWDIAVSRREITRLRAQARSVPVDGPQIAAVIASHNRALENYARPVLAAEAAHATGRTPSAPQTRTTSTLTW